MNAHLAPYGELLCFWVPLCDAAPAARDAVGLSARQPVEIFGHTVSTSRQNCVVPTTSDYLQTARSAGGLSAGEQNHHGSYS
jgi:hypothetical protein